MAKIRKNAKNQPAVSDTGTLKLPLGASLSCSSKRMAADLLNVLEHCRIAQNAMIHAFMRYHWEHPGYCPPPVIGKKGQFKDKQIVLRGIPMVQNDPFPREKIVISRFNDKTGKLDGEVGEIGADTYLYHHGRAAVPTLGSDIVTACSNSVMSQLKTNMPYNHKGKTLYVWDAILKAERGFSVEHSNNIPLPSDCKLELSNDQYVLSVQLFSKGMRQKPLLVSIEAGKFPDKLRKLVLAICRGENGVKQNQSELVYHESDKKWYLHLVYTLPRTQSKNDPNKVAVLETLFPKSRHALKVSFGSGYKFCGWAPQLKASQAQQSAKRTNIRRQQTRRGHGRAKIYDKMKCTTYASRNAVNNYVKQTVADVIRFCENNDCGSIQYFEPQKGTRKFAWFAVNNTDFPWSEFKKKLVDKCNIAGIKLLDNDGVEYSREQAFSRPSHAEYKARFMMQEIAAQKWREENARTKVEKPAQQSVSNGVSRGSVVKPQQKRYSQNGLLQQTQ